MRATAPALFAAAMLGVLPTAASFAQEKGMYTNPIVTPVAADPSIIRSPDGS